jgi:hypothetical protein
MGNALTPWIRATQILPSQPVHDQGNMVLCRQTIKPRKFSHESRTHDRFPCSESSAVVAALNPYTLESQGRIVRVSEVNVRRRSSDIHPRPDAVLTTRSHAGDRQQSSNHGNTSARRFMPYVSIYESESESNDIFNTATFQLVFFTHQATCTLNNNHGAFSNPCRAHFCDDRLQEIM